MLTDYTWVARTPWQFHYGPIQKSRWRPLSYVFYDATLSFLRMDVFYGTVSWQWCICYDIVYMYTTRVWFNQNIFYIIITIDSEKYSISDGLSKSLVIWNQPVVMTVTTSPHVMERASPPHSTPDRRWYRHQHHWIERRPVVLVTIGS